MAFLFSNYIIDIFTFLNSVLSFCQICCFPCYSWNFICQFLHHYYCVYLSRQPDRAEEEERCIFKELRIGTFLEIKEDTLSLDSLREKGIGKFWEFNFDLFLFSWLQLSPIIDTLDWLTDSLADWLLDWLISRSIDRLNWLMGMIYRLIDWFSSSWL